MSTAQKIIFACIFILIAGGGLFFVWYREHSEQLFFSKALHSAGVIIPANASLSSLKLLYAQTMAERSPLFGIVGTDPTALSSAVSALATTTQAIAAAQSNAQDAQLTQSLYPIDFLRALARAEAAREAFIAEDSAANEQAYDAALHATASAGITESQAFALAIQTEIGTSTIFLGTTGDTISSSRILESASDIVTRMEGLSQELDARDACVSGNTTSCTVNDIALPQVAAAALPPSSDALPQLSSDVISTFSSVLPVGYFNGAQIVRFDSSICLDEYTPPYYAVAQPGEVDPRGRYLYIGDIIFTKPWPTIDAALPFMGAYGITYLYDDPFEFYQCPEAESDMSTISAIANTAQFARQHPGLAPTDAQALEGEVADDGYARKYVSDALSQATSSTDEDTLVSLALEFNEGNADLATLVQEIATLDQFNLQAAQNGLLPGGNNVNQLFETHSAFPSLFLVSSTATAPAVVSIREPNASPGLPTVLYSVLHGQVPAAQIVHDLKGSYAFEVGVAP